MAKQSFQWLLIFHVDTNSRVSCAIYNVARRACVRLLTASIITISRLLVEATLSRVSFLSILLNVEKCQIFENKNQIMLHALKATF